MKGSEFCLRETTIFFFARERRRWPTLVVGGTGYLGSLVAHALLAKGERVRILIRPASVAKAEALKVAGAEIALGDLKDPESLSAALVGVTKVAVTASATLSHAEGDSIDAIDRVGTIRLIDLAIGSPNFKHIVYISFPPHPVVFPLQTAKRAVENHIVSSSSSSSFTYTILQPTFFSEVWFSPAMGLDAHNKKAKVFGSGSGGRQWYVSITDVAKATVASLDTANLSVVNQTIPFGGPEGLSQRDVLDRVEKKLGLTLHVDSVPSAALESQVSNASAGDVDRTFAALMFMIEDHPYDLSSFPPRCQSIFHYDPTSIDVFIDSLASDEK
jgi:uncharacterized protein YbjT (DUF2867 family)